MPLKKYRPVTPSLRFRVGNAFTEITKDKPEKSLLAPLKKSGGRNNSGRRTVRHRGGGHKRRYRIIDFKRNKDGVAATVQSIEYDPNRSAYIALLEYADNNQESIVDCEVCCRPIVVKARLNGDDLELDVRKENE